MNEQQWFKNLFEFLSHRYYDYIFGFYKWRLGSDKVPSAMELQKLEVSVITNPQCDSFPNITSDESCEYLCHGTDCTQSCLLQTLVPEADSAS